MRLGGQWLTLCFGSVEEMCLGVERNWLWGSGHRYLDYIGHGLDARLGDVCDLGQVVWYRVRHRGHLSQRVLGQT